MKLIITLLTSTLWFVSRQAVADPEYWLLIDTTVAGYCSVVINSAGPRCLIVLGPPAYVQINRPTVPWRVNWPTGTWESKLAYRDMGGKGGPETTRKWDAQNQ